MKKTVVADPVHRRPTLVTVAGDFHFQPAGGEAHAVGPGVVFITTPQQHLARGCNQGQIIKRRGVHTGGGFRQAPHIDQRGQQHFAIITFNPQKPGRQIDFYKPEHLGVAFTDIARIGPIHLPFLQRGLALLEQLQQAFAGFQIRLKAQDRRMPATGADGGHGKGEFMPGRQQKQLR